MEQNWIQVDIFTATPGLEPVGAALADIGFPAFSIQDSADFADFLAGKNGHWDYIDDDLMRLKDAETTVTVYVPENSQGQDGLPAIRDMLTRLKQLDTDKEWGRLEMAMTGVREQDWAGAWKQYYKPVKTGEKLVICPSWESYDPSPEETVLLMDPGMAFGTGAHDSTRLCLQTLEEIVAPGADILDVGCGSGILSIAGLLLGGAMAVGVDIDEVAVRVAQENANLNKVGGQVNYICGDLARDVTGQYDIVCANIVADIIMRFAPDVPAFLKKDGRFLVSGIIDTRGDEVIEFVTGQGFVLRERKEGGGWLALLFALA